MLATEKYDKQFLLIIAHIMYTYWKFLKIIRIPNIAIAENSQ